MASSTARNCLSNSSLLVVFFDEFAAELAEFELFDDGAGAFASELSLGARFFVPSPNFNEKRKLNQIRMRIS